MRYWSADTLFWRLSINHCNKLTQVDLYIFFGRHLAQLRRLLDKHPQRLHLSKRYCHMTRSAGLLVWQLSIDTNIQCHLADVNTYVTLCLPSLHGWLKSPQIYCKSVANLTSNTLTWNCSLFVLNRLSILKLMLSWNENWSFFLSHSRGYAINKWFIHLKVRRASGLTHHSKVVIVLAPKSGSPTSSLPRAMEMWTFPFSFFSLFFFTRLF